ncbi:MAG TPA: farnesyl diphosphate synthase [Syntrophomonadaceae bacterium]|nr:farnesyl diphosphate synthase [Syntrophomonadaceae bacterium]
MDFDGRLFKQELKKRKEYVDSCLERYLSETDAFPPLIHQAMHYAVFNGGKRIRPIMVMEGALLAGGQPETVAPCACALELIHSYSLVHDDLPAMDDDDFRRGQPTCHRVFGEANAILTGDALLTRAFEVLTQNADLLGVEASRVLKVIGKVARAAGSQGMIGGQVIDLDCEGKSVDYQCLQTMHSLKTGELFRCALQAGAVLCGMDDRGLWALDEYARHFGMAFQITDDILDIQGDETLIGKPVGSDEKNQKTTFPSLFGLDRSQQMARESVKICLKSLEGFDQRADFLRSLATYLLQRDS